MTPNEISGWIGIAEKLGPFGPIVLVLALILYSASQRSKTEYAAPVTRLDIDALNDRIAELEKNVSAVAIQMTVIATDIQWIKGRDK